MTSLTNFVPLGGDLQTSGFFLLEIDGMEIGFFQEVHGLQVTVATEEIREGGQNGFTHKVPGRMSWPNITFKRGVTQSNALFEWLEKSSGDGFATKNNKLTRTTGAVVAITPLGVRLRSWNLVDVFPVRWNGPDFAVNSDNPLTEELEIAHHGFTASSVPGAP